ncbi:MAG: imidazolonepropionase [Actinomycetota bacterium]|nr:imidazolonepropionase [Actinomycetota bacterium]MDQ6946135.1 imidazolonepropionase [Actinomycetota bacterium]
MANGTAAVMDDAVVAVTAGTVSWVGPASVQPEGSAARVVDAGGRLVTPGLVDCHTHLVFGGHRADEYRRRLAGAGYEELAREGGGIMATVRATRAASEDELMAAAEVRLAALAASGVTTVEVKSGYGLDLDTELRMLRVARRLGSATGVRVVTTFLGAHAVPEEFAGRPDDYVAYVCSTVLPAVAAWADAVDVFCDRVGFTADQAALVLAAAQGHGLPVKLHADQLGDSGGAALAARFGALSADHLEHTGAEGVAALAASGTVAVLLPGAAYVLAETARPPVAALRAAGVPMAVATDANPGTSPLLSLPLAMHLACRLFGLTPGEALAGATCHAARALGMDGRVGVVAPGASADLVVWDATEPTELVYWLGRPLGHAVVRRGQVIQISSPGS